MKFTLTKTSVAEFDTQRERERITLFFKRDPETRQKLLRLVDLVERRKWKSALRLLESKWFRGRDQYGPRLEYVGLLFKNDCVPGFDVLMSYADLVYCMNRQPDKNHRLVVDSPNPTC